MSEIKRGNVPDAAREEVSRVLTRLGLTLNKAKTRQGDLWQEAVTFLVFESRMCRSARTGRAFPMVTLSAKALTRIRHAIKEQTTRWQYARCRPAAVMAAFNQRLRGWVQYFHYGNYTHAVKKLRRYVAARVGRYLHGCRGQWSWAYTMYPDQFLNEGYGLFAIPLTAPWKQVPVPCQARNGVGKSYARKLHVRGDEGALENPVRCGSW